MSETLKTNYHLLPGELIVGDGRMTVSTVLGSCVAVCFWSEQKQIGGINHVMLPIMRVDDIVSTRYANVATFVLFDQMKAMGCLTHSLEAKVFGGAHNNSNSNEESVIQVGKRNIEVTLEVLAKLNVPVKAKDIGGLRGRKISFDIETGKIQLHYLNKFSFVEETKKILNLSPPRKQ